LASQNWAGATPRGRNFLDKRSAEVLSNSLV
jgi:hypothetical protein